MAKLNNRQSADLFLAAMAIKRNARTLELASASLEDIYREALESIGGDNVVASGPDFGKIKDTSKPLGALDRLNLLEKRVDDIVQAVLGGKSESG